MQLVLSLLQQMSVSLVIAYLFSKSPLLRPLANYSVRLPHKVLIYVIFSCFCILGTYVGLDIDDPGSPSLPPSWPRSCRW